MYVWLVLASVYILQLNLNYLHTNQTIRKYELCKIYELEPIIVERWDLSYLLFMSWFIFYFFTLSTIPAFPSTDNPGSIWRDIFSDCHLLPFCHFMFNLLSVPMHRSGFADTKQARNNTKLSNFVHVLKVCKLQRWQLEIISEFISESYLLAPKAIAVLQTVSERKDHLPFK